MGYTLSIYLQKIFWGSCAWSDFFIVVFSELIIVENDYIILRSHNRCVVFDPKYVIPELFELSWCVFLTHQVHNLVEKWSKVNYSWYIVCHFLYTFSIPIAPAKRHTHFESAYNMKGSSSISHRSHNKYIKLLANDDRTVYIWIHVSQGGIITNKVMILFHWFLLTKGSITVCQKCINIVISPLVNDVGTLCIFFYWIKNPFQNSTNLNMSKHFLRL